MVRAMLSRSLRNLAASAWLLVVRSIRAVLATSHACASNTAASAKSPGASRRQPVDKVRVCQIELIELCIINCGCTLMQPYARDNLKICIIIHAPAAVKILTRSVLSVRGAGPSCRVRTHTRSLDKTMPTLPHHTATILHPADDTLQSQVGLRSVLL